MTASPRCQYKLLTKWIPSISSCKAAILAFFSASISITHAPLIASAIFCTNFIKPNPNAIPVRWACKLFYLSDFRSGRIPRGERELDCSVSHGTRRFRIAAGKAWGQCNGGKHKKSDLVSPDHSRNAVVSNTDHLRPKRRYTMPVYVRRKAFRFIASPG